MKRNLSSVIRKVAEFLDETLTDEQVMKLEEHLSFDNMKNNSAVNKKALLEKVNANMRKVRSEGNDGGNGCDDGDKRSIDLDEEGMKFMRKGEVGNWRHYFSNDLIKQFLKWETKALKESTLEFEFD